MNVVLDPHAKQTLLEAAIPPVADRLLKQFASTQEARNQALAIKDDESAILTATLDSMDAQPSEVDAPAAGF